MKMPDELYKMERPIILNKLILLTALISPVFAQTPLSVSNSLNNYPLGKHISIMEDKEKKLTIKDVTDKKYEYLFKPVEKDSINYGFTDSAYWVRFSAENLQDNTVKWYLKENHTRIENIELYTPGKNNDFYKEAKGILHPPSSVKTKCRFPVFSLTEGPFEHKTYYLRIEGSQSMAIALFASGQENYIYHSKIDKLWLGFFYGVLVVMGLYNFMLYFFIKEKSYLYYSFFIFSMIFGFLSFDSVGYEYFSDNLALFITNNYLFFLSVIILWGLLFMKSYLNITSKNKNLYSLMQILMISSGSGVLLSLFSTSAVLIKIASIIAISCILLASFAAVYRAKEGYKPAIYFINIFGFFFIGYILFFLNLFGIVPHNFITSYSVHFGISIAAVLLSFAIGEKIKRHEKTALESLRLAVTNMAEVNKLKESFVENLEKKVAEKTAELKSSETMRENTERLIRHDMKNPITGIIGLSDLLLDELRLKLNKNDIEYLSLIKSNSQELLLMIDHYQDIIKMEEGSYKLKTEKFNLLSIFKEIKKEFTIFKKQKNICINLKKQNKKINLNETIIMHGEKIHIKKLFANLIKNAIEASSENEDININLFINKTHYEIEIYNKGVIPARIRENFFEKYTTAEKVGGTGLGTYSAKLIAKIHNGDISFTTSEKDGTRLTVTLPA